MASCPATNELAPAFASTEPPDGGDGGTAPATGGDERSALGTANAGSVPSSVPLLASPSNPLEV
eukprot:CAMPEP_0205929708 /NCGR_PEP_ID=MMETSP1325-20131115/25469_1 /ASSEMBLY_ACC=CAM_ASM_000708 /TAXON_ID=236786 /ORGANISM="Florenciella sp., Strain RCC1007" /LENGTH=63 /DNA_ID=CAMNT_0053298971 /DNA_START=390 /DNA_END=581 /DNA_ORIENTATION=+